ncbi:MAG: methyl-accepting chemotaxis protein [Desulfobacteraceae bacterium]|nr:methyl-accepting chemotaxis protein [Desulfobacteraceae bacterium]
MEKIKTNAQLILSFSIICLALAIGYFAFEVHHFLKGFPEILVQMEKTSVEISPVIEGIAETSRNILPISEEVGHVAQIMPSILKEVKATREALPDILDQAMIITDRINKISEKLPDVLEEVRQTRAVIPEVTEEIRMTREVISEATEKVHRVQEQIPLILVESKNIRKDLTKAMGSIDKASDSVQSFTAEMGEIRPMIPAVLEEVKLTRDAMPEMLDQAERITTQGAKFGADAGKGVVSGLISVFNPITISKQLKALVLPGKDMRGLTAEDIDLIREATFEIVESGDVGTVLKWKNPVSRNYGKLSILREFTEDSFGCKELKVELWIDNDKSHDFNVVFCRQEDGSWIKKEKPGFRE